jgi:DNA repair protein RecN (Recombination protein N)
VAVERRQAGPDSPDAVTIGAERVAVGSDGFDHVEVVLAARAGATELPVARGASGGELSRVMLALEVALAGADPVGTLVFDEVDAGVGGRAATEIGRRLAALAATHQVIVVTHLAQVAAFASRHYVVDADADGIVGASAVRRVEGIDREAELARMLGGTDGSTARAHAAELLAAAGSRV